MASDVSARLSKFRIQDNRDVGLAIFGTRAPSTATITDGLVRGTVSQEIDGELGTGVQITDASARIARVWSLGNANFAFVVSATVAESEVSMDQVFAGFTRLPECALEDSCLVDPEAIGVGALGDVSVRISRSQIGGVPTTCGLFLADGADDFELRDSIIFDNDIGACVQVDGFDTSKVTNASVRYESNRDRVTRTNLPIPRVASD